LAVTKNSLTVGSTLPDLKTPIWFLTNANTAGSPVGKETANSPVVRSRVQGPAAKHGPGVKGRGGIPTGRSIQKGELMDGLCGTGRIRSPARLWEDKVKLTWRRWDAGWLGSITWMVGTLGSPAPCLAANPTRLVPDLSRTSRSPKMTGGTGTGEGDGPLRFAV